MDSQKHPLVKQAYSVADMQSSLQKQLAQEGMRDILSTALLGAGIAGTLRGGQGLLNLLSRGNKPLRTRSGISALRVPVSADKEEEEKEAGALTQLAGGLAGTALPYLLDHKPSPGTVLGSMVGGTALGGLASYLMDQSRAKKQRKQLKSKKQEELTEQELRDLAVLDDLAAPALKEAGEKQAFKAVPDSVTNKNSLWWYMPSLLAAGAGGAYGGWKLIDNIMDKRRRGEVEDELEAAKADYRDALESHLKEGSDSELGNALDALYDKMEKVSFQSLMPSANTLGGLGGAYATYAIPSALLGYLVVKNMTDKGSKRKVLEKAQKRRASKRQKTRPTELYAVPDPIEDTDEE